jgi:hypothetical protein
MGAKFKIIKFMKVTLFEGAKFVITRLRIVMHLKTSNMHLKMLKLLKIN